MKSIKNTLITGLAVAVLLTTQCANEEAASELEKTITFAAKIGTETFSCATATYTGLGSGANDTITQKDFRFYIHDVKLTGNNGTDYDLSLNQDGIWQYQSVVLLDFEDGTGNCGSGTTGTNSRVKGKVTIPTGVSISGIKFKLGVPLSLNHKNSGSEPAPLNISAMYWNWRDGYKFARLDFDSQRFDGNPDTTTAPFNIHLGSTGCNGSSGTEASTSCSQENRPEISLSYTEGQTIVADLKKLLEDTDLTIANVNGGGTGLRDNNAGCMSSPGDPECKAVLNNFGISLTYTGPDNTDRGVTNGTTYNSSGQKFFRVE